MNFLIEIPLLLLVSSVMAFVALRVHHWLGRKDDEIIDSILPHLENSLRASKLLRDHTTGMSRNEIAMSIDRHPFSYLLWHALRLLGKSGMIHSDVETRLGPNGIDGEFSYEVTAFSITDWGMKYLPRQESKSI